MSASKETLDAGSSVLDEEAQEIDESKLSWLERRRLKKQRAAAQKHLEGLLNKVQAYGSGRPMEKNTIDFLKGVREGVKELRIENASKQVILDNALDMSIDAEIMKIGLRPTYTQENRKTLQEL